MLFFKSAVLAAIASVALGAALPAQNEQNGQANGNIYIPVPPIVPHPYIPPPPVYHPVPVPIYHPPAPVYPVPPHVPAPAYPAPVVPHVPY